MTVSNVQDQQKTETVPARRATPVNEPIDRDNVGAIQLVDTKGGLAFNSMVELMDFAKLMAVSGTAIPEHLRMNPGGCMAICMYALEWRMSPFAIANKSYSVKDRLAFEAAVYQAVVSRRAPITGRIKMEFSGKGDSRTCRVWATLADGTGDVDYGSPMFGVIQPKNSPLWKNDPDQQLFYFSVRAWARRHFADVMMGIYTVDELVDNPDGPQRAAVPMPKALPSKAAKPEPAPSGQAAPVATAPGSGKENDGVTDRSDPGPAAAADENQAQDAPDEAEQRAIREQEVLGADWPTAMRYIIEAQPDEDREEAGKRLLAWKRLNIKGDKAPTFAQRVALLAAVRSNKLLANGTIQA